MGLKRWLIERWGGTLEAKEEEAEKEIKGYELYDQPAGGRWAKVLDLEKAVDFDELEDAQPGHTYKLQVRYTSGQVKQIWYRHLPGPIEEKIIDPIEVMEQAMEPMAKFGARISNLQESIRGAFGWAFPTQPTGGGGEGAPSYSGTLSAYLHPSVPRGLKEWAPVFKEWTKGITEGVREGVLGGGSEEKPETEKKVEFKKPSPKPGDYLQKEETAEEAE